MPIKRHKSTFVVIAIMILYSCYALIFIWRSSFLVNGERYFALLDDAMISMRYAKHFASGQGLVWNIGEQPIEGITNPLWALYMSAVHLLPIPSSKISLVIQLTGFVALLLNLVVIARIAWSLSCSIFVVVSSLVLTGLYFSLNTWGLQGMEVSILTIILSVAVLDVLMHKDLSLRTHIFFVGASLVRIDVIGIYIALIVFVSALNNWKVPRLTWIGILFLVAVTVLQTSLRYWYYGDLLPNTYYLKMVGSPLTPRVMRGLLAAWQFINHLVVLVPVVLIGFIRPARRTEKLVLCFPLFIQLSYSIYVGGDAWEQWGLGNRFVTIAMPSFFVCFSWALYEFILLIQNRIKRMPQISTIIGGAVVCVCLIVVNSVVEPFPFARILLVEPPLYTFENARAVYRAKAIEQATLTDASVAVVEAGTLPYFLDRTMIDILGKNDRVIAHLPMRFLPELPPILSFYPGHMKWDYAYSIGVLQPDVIESLWSYQNEAEPYLKDRYESVKVLDEHFYVRRNSNHLRVPPDTIKLTSMLRWRQ